MPAVDMKLTASSAFAMLEAHRQRDVNECPALSFVGSRTPAMGPRELHTALVALSDDTGIRVVLRDDGTWFMAMEYTV